MLKKQSLKLPLLEDFLLYLTTSNYSPVTIQNYERDLSIFEQFLDENNIDFNNLKKQTIDIYKADLLSRDRKTLKKKDSGEALKAKSINRMLTSLRSYITFLIDRDVEVSVMPQHIKLLKVGKSVMHLPGLQELIGLIEFPTTIEKNTFIGIRNRTLFEIIFASGMRISETISLNMDQIDQTGRIFIIGKGRKQRFVYLTPRSLTWLNNYLQARQEFILASLPSSFRNPKSLHKFKKVFLTQKSLFHLNDFIKEHNQLPEEAFQAHISDNYLQAKIKEYRSLLGISMPVSVHSLRHGFATYLAESGANPAAIQILLGHESLETTTKYVHASDKYAQKTHEEFHPLK